MLPLENDIFPIIPQPDVGEVGWTFILLLFRWIFWLYPYIYCTWGL